jgi:hypothetical protein
MRRNSKLMRLAGKLLPIMHERYREMCSLAAAGELGGPQMAELNDHIAKCDSCRRFLESVAQVSMQVMPALADGRVSAADIVPPQGMRARFLSRLAAEELSARDRVTPGPAPMLVPKPLTNSPGIPYEGNAHAQDSGFRGRSGSLSVLWRPATIVMACAVIGIIGFYVGHRTSTQTPKLQTQLHLSVAPGPRENPPADGSGRLSLLEQQKKDIESRLRKTNEKLNVSETQEKVLSDKLADANDKLAALIATARNERQRLTDEGQQAKSQVTYLQGEVDKLRWQLDDAKAKLAAQQNDSEQLRMKLERTQSDLQRELDLKSAKTEIGDLIAARNLHIVDVYDADPNGKRQRSFGRVFYIEGKSLVFYAYDLEVPGRFKADVVFHVWGGKAGVREVTHSLGILRKDDTGQSRWAMTFDDARVLAQINSVFVTAESANKHYDKPHGKKVLYAYFGSPPNHP